MYVVGTSGIDQSSGKPSIETVGPRGNENIRLNKAEPNKYCTNLYHYSN